MLNIGCVSGCMFAAQHCNHWSPHKGLALLHCSACEASELLRWCYVSHHLLGQLLLGCGLGNAHPRRALQQGIAPRT